MKWDDIDLFDTCQLEWNEMEQNCGHLPTPVDFMGVGTQEATSSDFVSFSLISALTPTLNHLLNHRYYTFKPEETLNEQNKTIHTTSHLPVSLKWFWYKHSLQTDHSSVLYDWNG